LVWLYWNGEAGPRAAIVVAILAISPYMILFGCGLFSEIFFLCLLIACFLAARKEGLKMAFFAGILAGLAYLTRTAGIALIVSLPGWYLLCKGQRREWRRALAFVAGMLPFI